MAEIEGLKELNRALKELPARAAKRALKSAIRAGGREIVKATRKELKSTSDSGNLSKSMGIKVLRPRTYSINAIIGPRTGRNARYDGWYAHFVEWGTAPHKITSKKVMSDGGRTYGREVEHPGTRPRPFMRPGYDKSKRKAVDAIGKKLWESIRREAAKLR